jgi:hypothetical protein
MQVTSLGRESLEDFRCPAHQRLGLSVQSLDKKNIPA